MAVAVAPVSRPTDPPQPDMIAALARAFPRGPITPPAGVADRTDLIAL